MFASSSKNSTVRRASKKCKVVQNQKLQWVPLSLFYVEYRKGDFLGFLFALSSLLPIAVFYGIILLVFFRSDLENYTIPLGVAAVLNQFFNFCLKKMFKRPRPLEDRHQHAVYGMPSSHAQHTWFFTAIFAFQILHNTRTSIAEYIALVVTTGISCFVTYGRAYLKYHTWMQIVVGGVFGCVYGGTWFLIMKYYFRW